ncbi:hypothetical protein K435DRAFT_328346 [Dendrothele bispora CBS 962.96]|uniref:Uncharacterized protein n=1 Tax=Dendrothele bispora (strain CBS 962.96) TaxID=1314807 RepID=A0A4S8MVX5_DENBC|nr:hypothetical protein K435DRAFT_328346 [Dendrothele bispora CBS 962.96]
MFAKIAAPFVFMTALTSSVIAAPAPFNPQTQSLNVRGHVSFNNWGGLSSLHGFDNFYGSDNFSGVVEEQVVVHEQEVVCHSQSVEIIQQRLLVLQEMAKKIITEQICEVETQTIVFQQFVASSSHFSSDLQHVSGHQVGYDSSIASHYGSLIGSDGSLTSNDLGFSGQDLGKNTVVVSGNNWNDQSSPASVQSAYSAAQNAINA